MERAYSELKALGQQNEVLKSCLSGCSKGLFNRDVHELGVIGRTLEQLLLKISARGRCLISCTW